MLTGEPIALQEGMFTAARWFKLFPIRNEVVCQNVWWIE